MFLDQRAETAWQTGVADSRCRCRHLHSRREHEKSTRHAQEFTNDTQSRSLPHRVLQPDSVTEGYDGCVTRSRRTVGQRPGRRRKRADVLRVVGHEGETGLSTVVRYGCNRYGSGRPHTYPSDRSPTRKIRGTHLAVRAPIRSRAGRSVLVGELQDQLAGAVGWLWNRQCVGVRRAAGACGRVGERDGAVGQRQVECECPAGAT